jgi:integrase
MPGPADPRHPRKDPAWGEPRHPRWGAPKLVRRPGRRKWYVRWTPPGSRRNQVVSTGIEGGGPDDPPPAARAFLDEFIRRLADSVLGRDPRAATIADLLDARLAEAQGRVAAWDNMRLFHDQLKSRVGHIPAAGWSEARNEDYIRARPPSAARRELEELRAALRRHARAHPGWPRPGVPVPAVRLPRPPPPREHAIDRAQAARLLAAARPFHLRLFILVAMTTGARAGAILDLTWDRVDLDRGILDLRDPARAVTNKRRGVVPVDAALVCVLRQARAVARCAHVVEYAGRRVTSVRRAFRAAVARADLPAWLGPHVLKHSVISWLAEAGFPADLIGDLTETDPRTIRRIYRKVRPDALRPLAAALASGLPTGPAPTLWSSDHPRIKSEDRGDPRARTADARARQAKARPAKTRPAKARPRA